MAVSLLRPIYTVRLCRTQQAYDSSLRHEFLRVNQTYNSLTTLKSCRRPVVSFSHATKSYRVKRPLKDLVHHEYSRLWMHKIAFKSRSGNNSLTKMKTEVLTN